MQSDLFDRGGLLERALEGYELREAQVQMAHLVAKAFARCRAVLIEAGTGIGKSLAYLVPALLSKGKRTVVSTHTINLQEQLIHKDIPRLVKAIAPSTKVVLVKGMSNYLCLRRLADAQDQIELLDPESAQEVKALSVWAESAEDGSLAELPFYPKNTTWDRLVAERDSCTHARCPFYKRCFFFKARQEAEEADLLVVNHHLLMADLRARREESQLLPDYDQLVVDEAHHLEDVATESLAWRLSRRQLYRWLNQLAGEGVMVGGKLALLRQRIGEIEDRELALRLDVDLPVGKTQLTFAIQDVFRVLGLMASGEEGRFRLTEVERTGPRWLEEVEPILKVVIEELKRYAATLRSFGNRMKELLNVSLLQKSEGVRQEISALAERFEQAAVGLHQFGLDPVTPGHVRWVEISSQGGNVHVVHAQLDVSHILREQLFEAVGGSVLTSATMTTGQSFDFYRGRLGLSGLEVEEATFPSPFDYTTQAQLLIANDLPLPADSRFTAACTQAIGTLLRASRGGVFVLFTSYQMMNACAEALRSVPFPLFVQGEQDRRALLEGFRKRRDAVLFGTDSFWEGVDVVGDTLRCVILTKLPFKVPTEPLIQARLQAIEEAGGNPFGQYSLPQAVVKFKQGFGRLIRSATDRGVIVCLDRRLVEKPYGKAFITSLPDCPRVIGKTADLASALKSHLEKK